MTQLQQPHTNDEFNQLEAAFNATTGHDHSGAGEGGPIAALASHGILLVQEQQEQT